MNGLAELVANLIVDQTDVPRKCAVKIGAELCEIIVQSLDIDIGGDDSYSDGFNNGIRYVKDVVLLLGETGEE